jgi:UDP-2-acetamido-2-deoxy-ribo-hexuluronate aminotransferase
MDFIDLKSQYRAARDLIDGRIQRVLDHGQYIMGPEVAELEVRLAAYTGARHCITVASGTEALLVALMALGIRPGDEVITTPFTFIATAEVIVLLGAVPVFVDVDARTGNLDPALIAARIGPRTRAMMPVALYGQPADMDEINAIAARHGLAVVEDAAQSFGATYRGRRSGNLSTIGCTSFFPSKPLGCYGDGGALFTNDDALAQAMREIRVHGQSRRYVHTRIGVGGRMDTLQCAIVLAKLGLFEWEIAQRQRTIAHCSVSMRPPPLTMPCWAGGCAASAATARAAASTTTPSTGPACMPSTPCWSKRAAKSSNGCRRPAFRRPCIIRCRCTCSQPTRTWTRAQLARWHARSRTPS